MDLYRDVIRKSRLGERLVVRLFGTVTHVMTSERVAALTFDDGPDPDSTPRLLEVLEKYRAKATFFMVGEAARRNQELVAEVARAGHTIANHSLSHRPFTSLGRSQRFHEVRECQRALAPHGRRFFRPPRGYQDLASRIDLMLLGYKVVAWSVSSRDWLEFDQEQIAGQLLSRVRPGSIILLHDAIYDAGGGAGGKRHVMLGALEKFLEKIGTQFRFVTLPELFRIGKPQKTHWFRGERTKWPDPEHA